jgi:DNA methylase
MSAIERGQPQIDVATRLARLHAVDWDFPTAASQSPFSGIHWHPCRFPSQVPATLIGTLTRPNETVLDPFVGSGTVAVEAQRLGRNCIAIDLNPIACTVVRAKTINKPARAIGQAITNLKVLCRQSSESGRMPDGVQSSKWYTHRTVGVLRRLRAVGDKLPSESAERSLFEAAFSAILLPVCRETRHWGYVCDNTEPKGDHERDVIDTFERVLDAFARAYRERDEYWRAGGTSSPSSRNADIKEGDAETVLRSLGAASVDLIVTSPPYFGVTDYTKAQRLSLEWVGRPIEPLRLAEIGARSKRHRHGADALYLDDCRKVFVECRRVLRTGRVCAVVFGQSTQRASVFDEFVLGMKNAGFRLHSVAERRISAQRRQNPSVLSESLLLFR